MDRRTLLKSAGAIAAATLAAPAFAAHEHHHAQGSNTARQKLLDTTSQCIQTGNLCLAHCLVALGDGEQDMAACAQSVNQMLSVCTALAALASQDSKYLRDTAKLAANVCKDCEIECKKHAEKHEACNACMEACQACRKECEAIAA